MQSGGVDVVAGQTAASRNDTLKAAPDFFVARRRMFRATMIGRCAFNSTGDAVTSYQKVRALLTDKLAGHFPFVDSAKAATAPDADPAAVREFYAIYDAFAKTGEPELRSDPRFRPGGSIAFIFLDQVAGSRAFFSPFIDSASTRKSPEYAFVVDPIKKDTPAERQLRTGTRSVALADGSHSGVWGFGEAVKIVSSADSSATPAFVSTGWWSLVELAALQHETRIRIYHPDTMIELRLPTFPKVAPDLPTPRSK